jgi:hypothetical protein
MASNYIQVGKADLCHTEIAKMKRILETVNGSPAKLSN